MGRTRSRCLFAHTTKTADYRPRTNSVRSATGRRCTVTVSKTGRASRKESESGTVGMRIRRYRTFSSRKSSVKTLRTNLGYLRSRGHEVMIIRTLDPAELELQVPEPGMVVDLETGQEIYLDPDVARDEYRRRFDEHRQQLRAVADGFGVTTHTVTIDQPLDRVLFDIVNGGARGGRGVARGGAIAAASRGAAP